MSDENTQVYKYETHAHTDYPILYKKIQGKNVMLRLDDHGIVRPCDLKTKSFYKDTLKLLIELSQFYLTAGAKPDLPFKRSQIFATNDETKFYSTYDNMQKQHALLCFGIIRHENATTFLSKYFVAHICDEYYMSMCADMFIFHDYENNEHGQISFKKFTDNMSDIKCTVQNIKILKAEWTIYPKFFEHYPKTYFAKYRNDTKFDDNTIPNSVSDTSQHRTIDEKYFTYIYSAHATPLECKKNLHNFITDATKNLLKYGIHHYRSQS
jgi:hypothetical protein